MRSALKRLAFGFGGRTRSLGNFGIVTLVIAEFIDHLFKICLGSFGRESRCVCRIPCCIPFLEEDPEDVFVVEFLII